MTTTTTIPADVDSTLGAVSLIFIAAAIIVAAVVVYLVVRAMVTLAHSVRPAEIIVIMLLSITTLVAIVAYSITELDDLGVLAGTGIGAMAGAVTALYSQSKKEDDDG